MPDIEKVIKGLEICLKIPGWCKGCPYEKCDSVGRQFRDCTYDLRNDAIELLKEQQEQIDRLLEESASKAEMAEGLKELLKGQDERLRKLQKDKDKLCLEVSEWKHKFHDAPPKFVSQRVVDQIRWERDTALSQLEQIGKGLGSKMDDIVALLKEQNEEIENLRQTCQSMMEGVCLLKEQEAKEVEAEVINEIDRLYRCPSCHISMMLRGQPYCHYCGQELKWE